MVERSLFVAYADGELLFDALFVLFARTIRRDEIDSFAVGRELPGSDGGRVFGQLLWFGGFDLGDRQNPHLLIVVFSGRKRQPFAVAAEREGSHAVFGLRDLARLAAVGAHQVKLVLIRVRLRRFAVRGEDKILGVARPSRRRFVLILGVRHLPG